ncbi:Uncharacterised protein [Mycobacteroides abscessus subsp. abscessus]|nr:Uncharacterised protein [Mycobacteroides abscessus subsp. abscessus]
MLGVGFNLLAGANIFDLMFKGPVFFCANEPDEWDAALFSEFNLFTKFCSSSRDFTGNPALTQGISDVLSV